LFQKLALRNSLIQTHKENGMAKTAIDNLGWGVNLILTIFFDPLVQGINRILRGKLIIGVVWIITGGIFGIGWIVDIVTMITKKDITVLA
jgi:tryptophan-rich sensory protein